MKLLLPTDGKAPAENARELLITLGHRERVEITVLSVNGFSMALEQGARLEHHYSPEAGRSYTLEVIDRTVEYLRSQGFRAEGQMADGYPPYAILGEVEHSHYELALLGSGSASWLGQLLLGSVATNVLHGSPSSVLIAHDAPIEGQPKVLYGADGSRGADYALRNLIGFADPSRAEVTVACVVRSIAGFESEMLFPPEKFGRAEMHRRHQEAQRVVDRATDSLAEAGFEATGEVLTGHPTEQLLKAADGLGASLVAVGSRGLGALDRAVLGSVSDKVVRHARAALVGRETTGGAGRDGVVEGR